MFEIAPHGKTIIATFPYKDRKATATFTKEEARIAVARLAELVKRHAEPGDDVDLRQTILVERQQDGVLLSSIYVPRVAEDGNTCSLYLSLSSAFLLANEIRSTCLSPDVRKRTRSAPGAPVRVRKRVRKHG